MAGTARSKAPRSVHRCAECGHEVAKWVGRCPECQAWGTLEQVTQRAGERGGPAATVTAPALPIAEVDLVSARARPTGVAEFDRVLGGGLVPGSVVLLAGEPGVGKSTLLLEVANRRAMAGDRALYVTGEESAGQVRLRAERTGTLHDELYLAAEGDLDAVLAHLEQVRPSLVVIDSVQTISCADVDGSAGGVSQVRAVAATLISAAKSRNVPVILVGHVTKDGSVAGPRLLEHLVDVVLNFEGDRHSTLRMVRGVKNRFGAADEVGCFELRDDGIAELSDPSGLFLNKRDEDVPGTAVTVAIEGKRAMLAEIQALTVPSSLGTPRRTVSGLDSARVSMLVAVLQRRAQLSIGDKDVYAATVGGMRVTEPAADLAIALALTSSLRDQPLLASLVVIGEVGLAGEVRRTTGVGRRLAEAARLGFTRAMIPKGCIDKAPEGMRVIEVADLNRALELAKPRPLRVL